MEQQEYTCVQLQFVCIYICVFDTAYNNDCHLSEAIEHGKNMYNIKTFSDFKFKSIESQTDFKVFLFKSNALKCSIIDIN